MAFKSTNSANVGTTPVAVLTATAVSTLIGLSLANVTVSQITVSVTLTKGATVTYLVKDAPVAVGGSLVLFGGDQKLVLEIGNAVTVTSSAATSCDVVASYLEV